MNPIIINSLQVWSDTHKLINHNAQLSPNTPIWGNPYFKDDTFKLWHEKGLKQIAHLFENGILMSFEQLQQLPRSHQFRFVQVRNLIRTEQGSLEEPKPSRIESLMNRDTNVPNCISKIYKILIEPATTNTLTAKHRWEEDLEMDIDTEDWTTYCLKVHKCSYNMIHKLSLFDMLHRTYYTPDKLHKMSAELSFLCWRYKKQKGPFHVLVL